MENTLTRVHQMSGKQLTDLENLMTQCKKVDGNTLPIYKHLIDKRHLLPCNLLYYSDEKLVAYLRTFFFYPTACEIALMVAPEHRRKGIARRLIEDILPIVTKEKMDSLIFSTPKGHHEVWFKNLGLSYKSAEYQMQYDPNKAVSVRIKPASIRLATADDLPKLIELDTICFPNKKLDALDVFRNLMLTPNCAIFVLMHQQQLVGKAHVFKESDRARITDIAVYPEFRGQGFASSLIKYCINHAFINNKAKIVLDVEITNESALKLYDGLGFQITNAHDYWSTPEHAPEFGLSHFLHTKGAETSVNKKI